MRFSETELMQLAAIAAGGLVFLALVVALVRWLRSVDAIWPQTAKKYGLSFEEGSRGGALAGATVSTRLLTGTTSGVAVSLVATTQRSGRMSSKQTLVKARAARPLERSFSVVVKRGAAGGPGFHAVPTGDAVFDRQFSLSSDDAAGVRALLDPSVRAAILQLPFAEVGLSHQRGELCLSHHTLELRALELEAPLQVVIAAAAVDLSKAPASAAAPPRPAQAAAAPKREEYQQQLAQAHGFTLEQLELNRAGQLHPDQVVAAQSQGVGGLVAGFIIGLLLLGAGVGGAIALYDDFRKPISRVDMNGIYLLGGAGVVLGGGTWLLTLRSLFGRKRRQGYAPGGCRVVEGPVQKNSVRGSVQTQSYVVGGVTFAAPLAGWELMTQGARYKIYFLPDVPDVGPRLLSLEPA